MRLIWLALSGIGILGAAFLMLSGNLEAAFVVAVLGIVCWFLNYRMQMKEITKAADVENKQDESSEV